jgi:hypothetical protein
VGFVPTNGSGVAFIRISGGSRCWTSCCLSYHSTDRTATTHERENYHHQQVG